MEVCRNSSLCPQNQRTKIKVIEHVLNRTAGFAGVDYVLWIEQNALVRPCLPCFGSGQLRRLYRRS